MIHLVSLRGHMKQILNIFLLSALLTGFAQADSRYSDLWSEIKSDSYGGVLPHYEVSISRFIEFSFSLDPLKSLIARDARRTLSDTRDLRAPFTKLVHANGICLAGRWVIDTPTPYSGYFSDKSEGLIIARASVALNELKRGSYRSFGMAGKVFATLDPDEVSRPANFFVLDDLAGTLRQEYLAAPLLNEPPFTGKNVLSQGPSVVALGAATAAAFALADHSPTLRQVYPIAQLGLTNLNKTKAPRWMLIQGSPESLKKMLNKYFDFRRDLEISNYADERIIFDLSVASEGEGQWKKIGYIEFVDSAISKTCDRRLHFSHPKFVDKIGY